MKRFNKLIIFAMLCLLPIVVAMIPASNAPSYNTILGDHHQLECETGYKRVSMSWTVTSGPDIDVYIFTAAQYSMWALDPNTYPDAWVFRLSNTSSGTLEQVITKSLGYCAVFSNEMNGTHTASGTFTIEWSNVIPGFGLYSVLFSILFIGICVYMGRKFKLQRI